MSKGYLLDTHTWLWWHTRPECLSERVRKIITDPENRVDFSAASAWEIAIKMSIGKLRLPDDPERYVPAQLAVEGFTILPVALAHALRVSSLPPHHPDPFDRLLIAQAQCEELTLLSSDGRLRMYDVPLVW